jgi:hypothetical protein
MRKEIDVTIADEGRDKGKVFHIIEMPALRAEKWATKALFALAQAGVDLPADLLTGGMSGIAILGIQALLNVKYQVAEPLIDEMMTCVQIKEAHITRPLTQDDIEETRTFFTLRGEVLKLHVGFSTAGGAPK